MGAKLPLFASYCLAQLPAGMVAATSGDDAGLWRRQPETSVRVDDEFRTGRPFVLFGSSMVCISPSEPAGDGHAFGAEGFQAGGVEWRDVDGPGGPIQDQFGHRLAHGRRVEDAPDAVPRGHVGTGSPGTVPIRGRPSSVTGR